MERIFESEYRFLKILWENEPAASPALVKLCAQELGWKKSTTYTVIRRLTEKGIIRSEKAVVESVVKKAEADRQAGEELLERTCRGDVPMFLAAFLKDRRLTREEADRIRALIEAAEEQE